jgi:hypothetical protein
MPRCIVFGDAPVALWTAVIPPEPHDFASAASASRRSRSFNRGNRSLKRARIPEFSSSSMVTGSIFSRTQRAD